MSTHQHGPLDEVRRWIEDAVRETTAAHPADAVAMVQVVGGALRRWRDEPPRWFEGPLGGGGPGIFADKGSIFVSFGSLTRDWDVELRWKNGRWEATAAANDRDGSWLAEFNEGEFPLAAAVGAGFGLWTLEPSEKPER